MDNNKKELTKVQRYAIKAATEKFNSVKAEFQSLLEDIAVELGINLNDPTESWRLSSDSKYLERIGGQNIERKD